MSLTVMAWVTKVFQVGEWDIQCSCNITYLVSMEAAIYFLLKTWVMLPSVM